MSQFEFFSSINLILTDSENSTDIYYQLSVKDSEVNILELNTYDYTLNIIII